MFAVPPNCQVTKQGCVKLVSEPAAFYQEQVTQLETRLGELESRCRWSGLARGVAFLSASFFFFAAFLQWRDNSLMWWVLFALLATVFLVFVGFHSVYDLRRQSTALQAAFFRQGLARLRRDWSNITNPLNRDDEPEAELLEQRSQPAKLDKVTIADLDLEGEKSLWRLLNLTRTPMGQATLHRWMLQAASLSESKRRQESVQALAEADQWRHAFLLSCWGSVNPVSNPATIVRWATGSDLSPLLRMMIVVARVSAGAFVLVLLAGLLGLLSPQWFGTCLFGIIIFNFLMSVFTAAPVHEIFRQVGARSADVQQYDQLLRMIDSVPVQTSMVGSLRQRLAEEPSGTDTETQAVMSVHRTAMRQLMLWSSLGNLRSGVTFILYIVLQFAGLWDLHILAELERWRVKWGQRLAGWFESLGELEALAALAQCRFDHPEWVFPELQAAEQNRTVIEGQSVGHPLLGSAAVANSITLGPWGKSLVVTGSNMSGKSTYLRAIGVNLILGRMGGAVDAKSFRMPAVEIGTSMRVADSLADGISFFMSELRRLKQIVDRSRQFTAASDIQYVYLLDEILQGTNSQERQIAVTRVIQQLLARKAVGAISTHDLQLPDVPELKGALDVVHFKESFVEVDGKQTMTFDYLMRPGVTPTTNALKLLALVGLDATE